jgi:predicted PurR-regulated permease PerM
MVSRNVAVALGIVCIILVALIAYFTVTGISAQNSYNNLQNQNKQLQTWLDGKRARLP